MAQEGTQLGNQRLMFDEVIWQDDPPPFTSFSLNVNTQVTGKPAGLTSGMEYENKQGPPYWEFFYELNTTSGIKFTQVVVKDSQSSGSTEDVFESIEFADFKIVFTDNTIVPFNLQRAFGNPTSSVEIRTDGRRKVGSKPPDPLFQRGIKLTLIDNVLDGKEICLVKLEISVVFRGAKNDIDPGGIPVGLKVWPQLAFTWYNRVPIATKRVKLFNGSVKVTVNNKMYAMIHTEHGPKHDPPPNANIASLFADSNTSMKGNQRGDILTGRPLRNTIGVLLGGPAGWGLLFDYIKPDVGTETEVFAVAAPKNHIVKNYVWPNPSDLSIMNSSANIELAKVQRQGKYDNIHVHAAMPNKDSEENPQIHAPFCGHSCVHMHWRWTSFSVTGATGGRGGQFKGWSMGPGAKAHSAADAPLVPPNQVVTIALCAPNATRFSPTQVVNPASPRKLDALNKLIWYTVSITDPNADEKQVIMEHGLGWAYRYTNYNENALIGRLYMLIHPIKSNLSFPLNLYYQQDVSDFFEKDVYPFFRYIEGLRYLDGKAVHQVPNGDYHRSVDITDKTSMEDV